MEVEKQIKNAEELYKYLLVTSWDRLHWFLAEGKLELFKAIVTTQNQELISGLVREITSVYLNMLKSFAFSFLLRISPHISEKTYRELESKIKNAKTEEDVINCIYALNTVLHRLGLIRVEVKKPSIEEVERFLKKFYET